MSINVGVVFGSRTVEHEVSIISAIQAMCAMDKSKYNVIPIYITKAGEWITGKSLIELDTYNNLPLDVRKFKKVTLTSSAKDNLMISKSGLFSKAKSMTIDVLFPVMHGSYGEDGSIQGLFDMLNLPYVGSGVIGSAVGMDKIIMKAVFHENGLPVSPYVWFTKSMWDESNDKVVNEIEEQLNYPLFVKPANLGSSIGISRAENKGQLLECIKLAIMYDRRVLVEEEISSSIEINCSVLGRNNPVASVLEQPVKWKDFLTYEEKYIGSSKTKGEGLYIGKGDTKRNIPADVSSELTKKIQQYSIEAFKQIDASGVARIDWLVRKDESKFYINEINTIPGSLSFYLWEHTNVSFTELTDRLIKLAIEVHKEKQSRIYTYDTNLLKMKINNK